MPKFFAVQPVIQGAVDFINELQKRAEVFIITAVKPEFMGIRAERLMQEFPMIPAENIIMGSRKDLVHVDVLLDDGAHNIVSSSSAYLVLFRRPWNQHMSGCLSVNTYDEFITLVDTILKSYTQKEFTEGKKLYCLVGASGSGKSTIADQLVNHGFAVKVPSYTTRKIRKGEQNGIDYYFVSKDEFLSKEANHDFFETTRYAEECYGSSIENIKKALEDANVVMPVDICGAVAIKHAMPEKTVICYVKRDKKLLIQSILERNTSSEDKANRIISLSDEMKNEDICDYVIDNSHSLDKVIKDFLEQFAIEE